MTISRQPITASISWAERFEATTRLFAIPIFANLVTLDEVFNFLVKSFVARWYQMLGDAIPSFAGLTAVDGLEILGPQVD